MDLLHLCPDFLVAGSRVEAALLPDARLIPKKKRIKG